ncbi:hypothetical protein [Paraburkholderia phenoliruptrix]|uniref:hypothetical protein n=1 Tax=Paraburkholderia phenoliruptrix TaxID=252970 RepID=UPI002869A84A|nr:hypothetical protein [Paraburkholderia phenoliruptrix]WMY08643.1 hypothetical protein P3F88_02375 [Paraburkholderia phenoliruptrix]
MEVMTIAELAERLFVNPSYVRRLLDEGNLPATRGPDGEPVVERAARVLQLTPEEVWMAQTLTDWRLAGVPAEPPVTADVAVQLAERLFAVAFWSRGRGC